MNIAVFFYLKRKVSALRQVSESGLGFNESPDIDCNKK